jgi:UDP-N-acetylmuramoyl-L-alanyl-D-glutamate--2,6-diaminopimelate ligase
LRLDDLAAGLVPHTAPLPGAVEGITADSRAVSPGMVFAALPGARVDGRAFIPAAVAAGAAAILAPEGTAWPGGVPPRPLLLAADARAAPLALSYRSTTSCLPTCSAAP